MYALCCLDGSNTERLAERAFALLNADGLRLALLYVVDVGPSHELERQRQRYLGMGQRGAELLAQMSRAEQEQGEEIVAAALEVFRARWPGLERIEGALRRGRPEQEILRLGALLPIDLIALCNRRVLRPGEPSHPQGPKSVGHVARFVLDHAPCPVLLLRP